MNWTIRHFFPTILLLNVLANAILLRFQRSARRRTKFLAWAAMLSWTVLGAVAVYLAETGTR